MRKISLIISVLIGFIGTVVYFMTIPTVDEEAIVNVVVEAGDEQVLEDIYFNGYVNDYTDFHVTSEDVYTTAGLSYLDRIDAPHEMGLQLLHQSYPTFVEALSHDYSIFSYNLVSGDNYLTSAYFELAESNFRIETEKLQLSILDKETNELQTDTIDRNSELNGDSVEIISLYEKYPTVKVLLSINTWSDYNVESTSRVVIGEYNFETKSYSEEKLLEQEGSFYGEYISQNKNTSLIDYYSGSGDQVFLFDYENHVFIPLDREEKVFLLDEENNLFAVANIEDETILQSFDMLDGSGLEVVEEVPLDIDFELTLGLNDYPLVEAELIGDYLYITQSKENYDPVGEVLPATMQVFNRSTGESLLSGYIGFDEKHEVNARSGMIDSIGQLSDF